MTTTIGVVGGGQLGRMLALSGYPLGFRFKFYDTCSDCPAGLLGSMVTGDFSNADLVAEFANEVDIVTFEFENVPSDSIARAESIRPVFPSHKVLAVSQDRLLEKQMFRALGLATPQFAGVTSRSELDAAVGLTGLPCVLKSRRLGYDGKGQSVIRSKDDLDAAWHTVGSTESILEQFIPFDQEVSALGVRSKTGEIKIYPLCHNTHDAGILRQTWIDPAEADSPLSMIAGETLKLIMDSQDYIGVLALELFVHRGQIIANEMAPRVHNSGHWTIDGAPTSQFENHIRAITGLPLGDVMPENPAGMVNIIGTLPDIEAILALPYARLHLYDKEPREGRKLGHVNVVADDGETLHKRMAQIASLIEA